MLGNSWELAELIALRERNIKENHRDKMNTGILMVFSAFFFFFNGRIYNPEQIQAGDDINPSPGATGSYPQPFILWSSSEPGLVRTDSDPPSKRVFQEL